MRLSFGHWVLALLTSSVLIGVGLLALVRQPSQPPLLMASQVVMTLRPSDLLFPPQPAPEPLPTPPAEPEPAPVAEVPKAPPPKVVPTNVEPIAAVEPVNEREPQVVPKPKPKPTPKPTLVLVPVPAPPQPPPPPPPVTRPLSPTPAVTSAPAPAIPAPPAPASPVRPEASISAQDRDAYRASLVSHLTAAKRYPKRAQRRRIQGEVTVSFVINKQGTVLSKQIEQSSGAEILDQAALSMVDRASPLPVPPPGYGDGPHSFRIPLSFSLR